MIELSTLENGITVITDTVPHVKTVSLNLIVRTGSRHEDFTTQGLSHFVEHMVFKGTKSRSFYDLAKFQSKYNCSVGAYTSHDHTVYPIYTSVETIENAFELLSDMLLSSKMDNNDIIMEQKVIIDELAMRHDDPDTFLFDNLHSTIFPNQNIGKPIGGNKEYFAAYTPDSLKDWYSRNYVLKNFVFSAAGNISHERHLELVQKYFYSNFSNVDNLPTKEKPIWLGGDLLTQREEMDQTKLRLIFKAPTLHDKNRFSHAIMGWVLGGGMDSILFQEIREKRGLVYSVGSYSDYDEDYGYSVVYADGISERIPDIISSISEQLLTFTDKINEEDIEIKKNQVKFNMSVNEESMKKRSSSNFSSWESFGKILSIEEKLKFYDEVTLDEVKKEASDFLKNSVSVMVIGDISEINPEEIRKSLQI